MGFLFDPLIHFGTENDVLRSCVITLVCLFVVLLEFIHFQSEFGLFWLVRFVCLFVCSGMFHFGLVCFSIFWFGKSWFTLLSDHVQFGLLSGLGLGLGLDCLFYFQVKLTHKPKNMTILNPKKYREYLSKFLSITYKIEYSFFRSQSFLLHVRCKIDQT